MIWTWELSQAFFSHNQTLRGRKPSFLLLPFLASGGLGLNPQLWSFSSSRSSGWCWPRITALLQTQHQPSGIPVLRVLCSSEWIFLSAWPRRDWSRITYKGQEWTALPRYSMWSWLHFGANNSAWYWAVPRTVLSCQGTTGHRGI